MAVIIINNSEEYRKFLKEQIVSCLEELEPDKRRECFYQECPQCGKKEYLYYPEYTYGHCNECSYERGLEHYLAIIEIRKKIYKEFKDKVLKAIDK